MYKISIVNSHGLALNRTGNLQPNAQDVRRAPGSPSAMTPILLFISKVALGRVRVMIRKNSNMDSSRIGLVPDRTGNLPNVHSSAQTKAHRRGGDVDAPYTSRSGIKWTN